MILNGCSLQRTILSYIIQMRGAAGFPSTIRRRSAFPQDSGCFWNKKGEKGEVHTGNIIIGDKDGRHFDVAAAETQLLHPCISRDHKWLCADRISYLGTTVQEGVVLVERATRKAKLIASTGSCKTGADHQHPSFNRKGDMILFSNPDANGIAQVCTIDLKQVMEDWQKCL